MSVMRAMAGGDGPKVNLPADPEAFRLVLRREFVQRSAHRRRRLAMLDLVELGYTLEEIADLFQTSRTRVHASVERVRGELRECFAGG